MTTTTTTTMAAPPIPPHPGLRIAPTPQHLPAYVAPLTDRIQALASQHSTLHARLSPLQNTPQQLKETVEVLHRLRGALQSRQTELRLLHGDVEKKDRRVREQRGAGAKMARSAVMPGHKGRRSKFDAALRDLDECRASLDGTQREAARLMAEIARREGEQVRLTHGKGELAVVEEQLDRLDEEIFGGPTPECPSEDALELDYLVHLAARPLLINSTAKEASCHVSLVRAQTHCKGLIKCLQSVLAVNISSGVASNKKFTNNLFANEGPKRTGRETRADMLRAKGQLGDMMTHYIAARGKRGCVRPLREVTLIGLEKAPGSSKGVTEQEYHASLQTSYAQARSAETFIRSSIRASLARSDAAKKRLLSLDHEIVEKRGSLRAHRRRIVEGVIREGRVPVEAGGGEPQHEGAVEGEGSYDSSVPLMVATRQEMRHETDSRALKLLRSMLLACEKKGSEVEDDNVDFEDRPGYYPYA